MLLDDVRPLSKAWDDICLQYSVPRRLRNLVMRGCTWEYGSLGDHDRLDEVTTVGQFAKALLNNQVKIIQMGPTSRCQLLWHLGLVRETEQEVKAMFTYPSTLAEIAATVGAHYQALIGNKVPYDVAAELTKVLHHELLEGVLSEALERELKSDSGDAH